MEDSQEDFDYEAANDHVILAKVVDPVFLADDNKPVNVVVPSDVSDSLSVQEIVDSNIEAAIVVENDQQTIDSNIEETIIDGPPQNQKTRSLREIYEQTPVSDEHLQYALFSS